MVLSVVCAYASCNRYRMMYSIPDTLSPAWIPKDCCSPFIYREWTAWPYWTWAPTSWQQFLTCTVCRGWKNSIWRAIRSETPRSQQALHMWRTWMQSCLATTTSPHWQIKRLQFWPALPCVAWTLPAMASGESTPGVGYVAHTMQHAAQHNTTQPPPLLPPPPPHRYTCTSFQKLLPLVLMPYCGGVVWVSSWASDALVEALCYQGRFSHAG